MSIVEAEETTDEELLLQRLRMAEVVLALVTGVYSLYLLDKMLEGPLTTEVKKRRREIEAWREKRRKWRVARGEVIFEAWQILEGSHVS